MTCERYVLVFLYFVSPLLINLIPDKTMKKTVRMYYKVIIFIYYEIFE